MIQSIAFASRAVAGLCAVLLAFSVGCGGGAKSGADGATTPTGAPSGAVGPQRPIDRTVSARSKEQFSAAVTFYKEAEKTGWNESTCADAARRFLSVAEGSEKMVEAYYNAGVVHQKCGQVDRAEEMYKQAMRIVPNHAPSLANMGEIYFRKGNEAMGRQYFDRAFQIDKKVAAAQINLAWILYTRIRATSDAKARRDLESEAITYLQRVLAVDNDNIAAYTLMALIYLEGAETNRSRLDVANLLLEEGKKRNDKFAPLYNAWGLLQLKKENVSQALRHFQTAVELDPTFTEARMNAAQVVGGFRKYGEAEEHFRKILTQSASNSIKYDATVGLGFALRGQGKIDEAAKSYEDAMALDKNRGDAFFNMGLLWKDFKTNDSEPRVNKIAYVKAKGYFNQFLSKPGATQAARTAALAHIGDCDEAVKILDGAISAMDQTQKPAEPATPATPAVPKK